MATVLNLLYETTDEDNNETFQLKNQQVFILPALPTPSTFPRLSLIG